MKVYKFGGASVKHAEAVRNVASILKDRRTEPLVVIVSAMGKTTNALERLVSAFYKRESTEEQLAEIKDYHQAILNDLFDDQNHPIFQEIHNTFVEIEWQLEDEPLRTYDFEYDQMVSIGEMLSTKIVSAYLKEVGISNKWVDVRDFIATDNSYRKAKVDWELTTKLAQQRLTPLLQKAEDVIITQGFVGSTSENFTTTLGREGSDFTAGILASTLDAQKVVIWKDVEGMLNADPKYFDSTRKLSNISYLEAVELAYYGATVIHPKTIKPLQNKQIPLWVKSFLRPEVKGTLIDENTASDSLIPSFIFKVNQILVSIAARDYSFITEENLSHIFGLFAENGIEVNLMQNAAISFSVCLTYEEDRINALIDALKDRYKVRYNTDLELLTVRHYDEEVLSTLTKGKSILVEQKSRHTARFVLKNKLTAE